MQRELTLILLIVLVLYLVYILADKFLFNYYEGPISDHFNGTHFHNPNNKGVKSFFNVIKWRLNHTQGHWPETVPSNAARMPKNFIHKGIRATYIGHATILIQALGLNIITDPVFGDRASPFESLGPKRVIPPGLQISKLPKIDIILLSHNHYDHMDAKSLIELYKRDKPLILTPLGNEVVLKRFVDSEIKAKPMDWYQAHLVNESMTIHLWPAQHWSSRFSMDRNRALWGGFVIESKAGNIYFPGDTGYDARIFSSIKDRFVKLDLALLPIGAYEPRWFMKDNHMNPMEAVMAFQDLGSPLTIAMHYGVFRLTDESFEAPLEALEEALKKIDKKERGKFKTIKVGDFLETEYVLLSK